MKKRILCLMVAFFAISLLLTVAVGAEESTVLTALSVNQPETAEEKTVAVSCGLDVIANRNGMVLAGLAGENLYFSAERFACAMNLSEIDSITVVSLPDISCGALYLGSEGVSAGQRIKGSDLSRMTYEEIAGGAHGDVNFEFSVNDSAYRLTCRIRMVEQVNESPTVSVVASANLYNETYRGIPVSGVLSAYDPEGDRLTYEIVSYPQHGRVVLDDERLGKYTYYPADSYSGEDSFCYVVYDEYGNYSGSARVDMKVSVSGIAPIYRDLIDDELHSHAISMTECGLMNGTQVGDYYYFKASGEVSRAEFLVTAMKAVGIRNVPDVEKTEFFDDESIGNEMKGYIALASSRGYISGKYVDGELCFLPDESIKMSEAAVIISNMIGYAEPKVVTVFADSDSIPAWSDKAIGSLYTLGVIEAPDMVSGAGETVTRGVMAKLINRTMRVIGR